MWQWILSIYTLPNKKQWNLTSTPCTFLFVPRICLILLVFGLPASFIFSILDRMRLLLPDWDVANRIHINFPTHPLASQQMFWALGVGNMQVSRASERKHRCFLLLYRGRMAFSVVMDMVFLFWGPQNLLNNYCAGWGVAEWASWLFHFSSPILLCFSSLDRRFGHQTVGSVRYC